MQVLRRTLCPRVERLVGRKMFTLKWIVDEGRKKNATSKFILRSLGEAFSPSEGSRCRRYDGYPKSMVDRFCGMGFDVPRVVQALRSIGISREGGRMNEELADEVVERLLSMP